MNTKSECPDPDQLAEFLDDRLSPETESTVSDHLTGCPACRQHIEGILEAESPFADHEFEKPSGPVQRLLGELDQQLKSPDVSGPLLSEGGQIDGFKLLKLLSPDQSGMGEVWKATQLKPARDVALKIIGGRSLQQSSLERFRREQQTIAQLNHDRIARLYSTGETESGRPWFAMEFVPGVHVTEFCHQYRLNLKERIELFLLLCDAVQAAHFSGIVHRDLKPANVIVAGNRTAPQPKLIDFGIALHEADVLADDRQTVTESVMGTFRYMSPEQAAGQLDPPITYRTDIYSLGVLLHELLTGKTPSHRFAPKRLPVRQMLAIAENAETLRPSDFVVQNESQIRQHLDNLNTNDSALAKSLQDDLDWIILKALEKAPSRRYESVQGFAADLQRYLSHKPVKARELKSTSYRLRKAFRRHRKLILTLSVISVLALMLTAAVVYQWWDSSRRNAEQVAGSAQINRTVSTLVGQVEEDVEQLLAQQRSKADWKTLRTDPAAWARRLQAINSAIQQAELVRTTTDYQVQADTIKRLGLVRDQYRQLHSDYSRLWQQVRSIRDQTLVRSNQGETAVYASKHAAYQKLLQQEFDGDLKSESAAQLAEKISASRTPWLWVATFDDYAATFANRKFPQRRKIREAAMHVDDDQFANQIRQLEWNTELIIEGSTPSEKVHQDVLKMARSAQAKDQPAELLTLLQSALEVVKEDDMAAQMIRDAAWHQANDHRLWFVLAAIDKEPEQQLPALCAALALDPDSCVIHGKLGEYFLDIAAMEFMQGRSNSGRKALDDSDRHLKLAVEYSEPPLSGLFYYNLAINAETRTEIKRSQSLFSSLFSGTDDSAIKLYQQAVVQDPNLTSAWNNLGRLYQEQSKVGDAEAAYRNAVDSNPDHVSSLYNLGLLLKLQQRLDEAETVFRDLRRSDANHIPGLSQLGEILQKQKHYDEAVDVFQRLLELSLKHPAYGQNSPQVQYAREGLQEAQSQSLSEAAQNPNE